MKKNASTFIFAACLLLWPLAVSAQDVDLTGTWVGETEVPNAMEPDAITMVITKTEEEYRIVLSDSMGMLLEEDAEDIVYKDNELSFNFSVYTGEMYLRVYMTLSVEGETMNGTWETEEGDTGTIVMTKK